MDKDLRQAEKYVRKIIKNLGQGELNYNIQVALSQNTNGKLMFDAWIDSPKENVQPIMFRELSMPSLLDKLEKASKYIDIKAVQIAYFEGHIERAKKEIEEDQQMIDKIKDSKSDK